MALTHIFCPTCGSKNDFANGHRPNFCSGCGYNFNSLAAFGGSKSSRPASKNDNVMDVSIDADDEQPGQSEDAGISRADIEIIGVAPVNKQTVGSFFQHPVPPEEARHELSFKGKRVNGKKTFEAFKSEAGFGGAKRTEIDA